jgi:hypothetical protein
VNIANNTQAAQKSFADATAAHTSNSSEVRQHQQQQNGSVPQQEQMMGQRQGTQNGMTAPALPPAAPYCSPVYHPFPGYFQPQPLSPGLDPKGGGPPPPPSSAFLMMGGNGGIQNGGASRMQIPVSQAGGNCPFHRPHSGMPHMLYWDASHPTGISLPLRQPNPPVYFNVPGAPPPQDKDQAGLASGSPMMSGTQSPTSEMTVSSSDMSGEETGSFSGDTQEEKLSSQLAYMSLNQNYMQQQQQQQQQAPPYYIQQTSYQPVSPPVHMGIGSHPLSHNGQSMQQMGNIHHQHYPQQPPPLPPPVMSAMNGQPQSIHTEGQRSPGFMPMNGHGQQQSMDGLQLVNQSMLQKQGGMEQSANGQLSPNAGYDSNYKPNGINMGCVNGHHGGLQEAQLSAANIHMANSNNINNCNGLLNHPTGRMTAAAPKMTGQQNGKMDGYQQAATASYANVQTMTGAAGQLPNNVQVRTHHA